MKPTCARCKDEITGRGKTGLCRPCINKISAERTDMKGLRAASRNGLQAAEKWRREQEHSRRGYQEPSMPRFKCLEGAE